MTGEAVAPKASKNPGVTPPTDEARATETCATCAHRQHETGQCKARYHVTFERGEVGDPCLCTHQAAWDTAR